MECSMKDVVYPFIASLWVETMCKKLRLPEDLKVTLGVQMSEQLSKRDGRSIYKIYEDVLYDGGFAEKYLGYMVEDAFERWVEFNRVEKREIEYTVYKRKNVAFQSYDDWKTASADDYYKEHDMTESVDNCLDDLREYVMENFDYGMLVNYIVDEDTDDIAESDVFIEFDCLYKSWYSEEKELLSSAS